MASEIISPLNLLLHIIPMDIKIKKNKDGSITKTITTVEEVTISVEEIEAEIQWKKNQIAYLERYLQESPKEYDKKVEQTKAQIENLNLELIQY